MLRVACFDACGCGVCARIMLSCPDARVSEKGWAGCVEEIPADTSRPATDCRPRAAPVRDGHAPGCTGRVLTRAGVVIFPRGRSGSSLYRSRFGGFAAQADPPRGARAPARRLVPAGRGRATICMETISRRPTRSPCGSAPRRPCPALRRYYVRSRSLGPAPHKLGPAPHKLGPAPHKFVPMCHFDCLPRFQVEEEIGAWCHGAA